MDITKPRIVNIIWINGQKAELILQSNDPQFFESSLLIDLRLANPYSGYGDTKFQISLN